jgi:filamentous hemagglutinin family protein
VTAGAATLSQSGATTTITQTTPNASLSFKSFNIGKSETVNFVQPSPTSVAVNRIFDTNGSQILGRLSANGQVYLINPNGILFGSSAVVNVGSLVASTLDVSDSALTNNSKTFSGAGTGAVVNQGSLTASEGGSLTLLGNTVSNTGTLSAPKGAVLLGGASKATLTFANNSLVSMQIDQSTLNTLVENGGLIKADGGMVVLNAGAKDTMLASVVNNTGVIQARTVATKKGVITLLGGMASGTANVGGTLDASAPNGGDGGFVETSAAHVKIAEGLYVSTAAVTGKTGSWLIDPADFTISAAGTGTVSGGTPSGDISNTTLQNALAGTDVTILSSQGSTTAGSGDINVNADVAWSANQLTLTAARSINVNAVMLATGTSKLVMNTSTTNGADTAVAGGTVNMGFNTDGSFKGKVNFDRVGTGFLQINGAGYTVVNSLGVAGDATVAPATPTLQGMASAYANFALGGNIDATATGAGGTFGATGFTPIGNTGTTFPYSMNGLGHTITGLTMEHVSVANVGLIGIVGAVTTSVGNVGLVGGSILGGAGTGGLVGSSTATSINNSYSTASVTGGAGTGGLMGATSSGAISNSYTTGVVVGGAGTGGLLGASVSGALSNSYATGDVTGTAGTGGVVGASTVANFTNVYATGKVTGTAGTGGLVGTSTTGNFTNTYATGDVTGAAGTGGLVGTGTSGALLKSYATGNVAGAAGTGGLIGTITTGLVDQTYALGRQHDRYHQQQLHHGCGGSIRWARRSGWGQYRAYFEQLRRGSV